MSLYRKYRPQEFDDVVGQAHIENTLRNALAADPIRIAHAYLFCGPRGTGKTTAARLLAKCLNCEQGPTATPCNQCDFCTRVSSGQTTMDLIEIDAASHTGVDNVREVIIDKVNVAPAQGRYRIYIIDEVHMLSISSFNALLKTLEEPPPHAVFVLATTDVHKVPVTITSRCQRFDFRRVGPADIVKRLHYVAEKENLQLSEEAARLIAQAADGALRDALTLLEQVAAFAPEKIDESDVRLVLGTVSRELLDDLMNAVAVRDASAALSAIERATEEGVSFGQVTRNLVSFGRDLLLLTVGYEGDGTLDDDAKKRRNALAHSIGRDRLTDFIQAMRDAEKEMKSSTDHRLLLELALVKQCRERLALPEYPQAREYSAPRENAPTSTPARLVSTHSAPPTSKVEAPRETAPRETAPDENVAAVSESQAVSEPSAETSGPAVPEYSQNEAAVMEESVEAPAEKAPPKKQGRRIRDLAEFQELWPFVLARVRKKIGVTAVAYLHDATPVALNDKQATLEFGKEFHYEKACEAAKRLPFEKVINECMDAPRQLKMQLREPPPAGAAVAEAPEETPPTDDEEDFAQPEEDIAQFAQNMFGAQVVARSGGG